MMFMYVIRSLLARPLANALAVLSIGLVIAACVLSIAFFDGMNRAIAISGRADNVVVLSAGILQANKSALSREAIAQLKTLPQVAQENGEALVSVESVVDFPLWGDTAARAVGRGITPIAFLVHDEVKITAGRAPAPGTNELLIGERLLNPAEGIQIGSKIELANAEWPIVGVFSASGSVLEREVWADRERLVVVLKRSSTASAVVRVNSPSDLDDLIRKLPELKLQDRVYGMSERNYYEATIGNLGELTYAVAAIVAILVVGAIIAAANTLHASLSGRMSELAVLWVVGNRRRRLLGIVIQEALVLCLLGAGVASALAAPLDGVKVKNLMGGELDFALPVGIWEVGAAGALGIVVALLGMLYPTIGVMRGNLAAEL